MPAVRHDRGSGTGRVGRSRQARSEQHAQHGDLQVSHYREDLRQLAAELLSDIAPETDPASLPGGRDIREELDIDSMDFLNFIVALARRTGLAIPEEDYPRLFTMDGIAAYVGEKT